MKPTPIAFALISAYATACGAATLRADSILCESDAELLVPVREQWKDHTGSGVMRTVDASIEFSKLSGKMQQLYSDLAVKEEKIRAEARMRGATAAQQSAAQAGQQSAMSSQSVYERMKTTCAPSGPHALPAEILEQRPVSGLSKIRVTFMGAPASLWTYSKALAP